MVVMGSYCYRRAGVKNHSDDRDGLHRPAILLIIYRNLEVAIVIVLLHDVIQLHNEISSRFSHVSTVW